MLASRTRVAAPQVVRSGGCALLQLRCFSASQKYDLVVIGGGPGGYAAAIKAGQMGKKTACIEMRGSLGGTCLNVGCIPSKALLNATHHLKAAQKDFAAHGIEGGETLTMNLEKMMAAKNKTVTGLTGGIEGLFKKNKVDYLKGKGKITGANSVEVMLNDGTSATVEATDILIASGSEVTPLPPVPVDNAAGKVVDSTGALDLTEVPEHLVVVGGGVIGLEMGSVWRRLGSKVTVVEFLDKICPAMDVELTTAFQRVLTKQGFEFKLNHKVTATEVTSAGVSLTVEPSKGGEAIKLDCSHVLVATGRRPYTAGLGLESVGIETDKFGRIPVDANFKTKVPSIRAIGDAIEGPMLAHKAEEDGIAAVEKVVLGDHAGHVDYDFVPGVIYTFPEVASVGKTEEQLKEAGIQYKKGKFLMAANSRARANQEIDGFVKVLADKDTDKILGIHLIGCNAGEMIAEGVVGMTYGASSEDLARTCHAHPTLSEAFKEACMATYDKPIHS